MDNWLQQSPIRYHLLLWVCLILLWGTSIHPETITLDTEWLVVHNPILSVHSIDSLSKIWLDLSVGTRLTLGAEYLPVRDLTVWLDWWLFGDSWAGHHLHSVLWYGASCSLLWSINQQLFSRTSIVWLGSLMFMLHPTHVESVIWLASRKDVVSLTFFLLSIRLYLDQKSTWIIGLTALLAYWSKNTAIVLGPLLVLLSICHHKQSILKWRWWIQWIPIAMPLIVGLWLTLKIGSSVSMFAEPRGANPLETLNIASQTWWQYTSMLLYPTNLSLFYAEPVVESWSHLDVLAGFTIGLSIIGGTIFAFYRHRTLTVSLLTIPLGLLPVSQITPIQNLMADRYLLIPSIGLTWLTIGLFQYLQTKYSRSWMLLVLSGLALSLITFERLQVFQNDIRLWTDVTIKQPTEIRGWTTLAALYRENGELHKSNDILRSAEKHHGQHPKILLAHGMNALRAGNLTAAELNFADSWTTNTDLREAGNNLAWVLQKRDPERSIQVAKQVTSLHPLYATGWDTLGNSCLLAKDWSCATFAFKRAIEIAPYRIDTYANLGSLSYVQKDWQQAAFWWHQTLMLNPTHTYAQQGLDAINQTTMSDKPIVP